VEDSGIKAEQNFLSPVMRNMPVIE